jgi:hypothetical protein
MAPVLPLLLDPELKTRAPLEPAVPELAERIVTLPLVVDVPSPLTMLIAPPLAAVDLPA